MFALDNGIISNGDPCLYRYSFIYIYYSSVADGWNYIWEEITQYLQSHMNHQTRSGIEIWLFFFFLVF